MVMVCVKLSALRLFKIQNAGTVWASDDFITAQEGVCRLCGQAHEAPTTGVNTASVVVHLDFRNCFSIVCFGDPFEYFERIRSSFRSSFSPLLLNLGYFSLIFFGQFLGLLSDFVKLGFFSLNLLYYLVALL